MIDINQIVQKYLWLNIRTDTMDITWLTDTTDITDQKINIRYKNPTKYLYLLIANINVSTECKAKNQNTFFWH
jgi:hypothetical protein